VLSLGLLAPAIAAPPKEVKRYQKLYRKGAKKMEAGRYEKAVTIWERLEPMAPENPGPTYALACGLAQLGHAEAGFEALDRAIALGFAEADAARNDEDLTSLRDDARFAGAIERMQANKDRWDERMRTMHRIVPTSEAEVFDSAQAIIDAFNARFAELVSRMSLLGWRRYTERHSTIRDDKLAALERYLAENAEAQDREQAMLETLHTAVGYKEHWSQWDGDAPLVVAKAERFLQTFPESEDGPGVGLQRAIATWKAFGEHDKQETLAARAAAASVLFASLATDHPEADEVRRAIAWQMEIALEVADGHVTQEVTELYDRIKQDLEEDEELAEYAWQHAGRAMFSIEGERSFDGVDLDGKRWTWKAMRGQVVLIDFWSTWCGPCVGELPYLKEAYDAYHDQGFEIVGVSLDGPDQERFKQECSEREIVWPQIYDGGGWETELARKFYISGIPTPVLLDREGRVAAMHEDARGEKLVEKIGELISSSQAAAQ
jgi:thiol-disulfide isomerase/thioredoxin